METNPLSTIHNDRHPSVSAFGCDREMIDENEKNLQEDQEPSTSHRDSESQEDEPTSENLRRILQQVQSTMKEQRGDLKSEAVSSTSSIPPSPNHNEELAAGQILGPFNVRHVDRPNGTVNIITVDNGTAQIQYLEIVSDEPILQRLKTTSSLADANALLYIHEDGLWLMTVRSVSRDEALIGLFIQTPKDKEIDENVKRYPCEGCDASFKSPDNLQAHRQLYCKNRSTNHRETNGHTNNGPNVRTPLTAPPIPPLLPPISLIPNAPSTPRASHFSPPNVLFLPVAFHDLPQNGIVQILGPAQTIVPIAVNRHSLASSLHQLGPPHLLVNHHQSTQHPPQFVKFSAGELNIQIPLVITDNDSSHPSVGAQKRRLPSVSGGQVVDLSTKRTRPLLLSTPTTSTTTPITPLPIPLPIIIPKSTENGEKPFQCACGVSFSAQPTLRAHQEHYCKLASRPTDPIINASRESPRKIPSRCSQCDFSPQSASQLSVHMRQVHAEVQAYVCQECGYRGFSQRGIRSHLRTHSNLDNMKFETLMNTHVMKVCHNGRNMSTSSEISDRNGHSPENEVNIKVEDSD